MAERTFLQSLVAEAIEFLEFVGEAIADPAARAAVIRDLGGNPAAASGAATFPPARLDAVRAYRDSVNPDTEAAISALTDILAVLDILASNIEVWADAFEDPQGGSAGDEIFAQLAHDLFEIFSLNYVRLRYPRAFFILDAASAIEELTSVYGSGVGTPMRVGAAFKGIGLFLWSPGRTISDLDPDVTPDTVRNADPWVDLGHRLSSVVVGYLRHRDNWKLLDDWMYGWDGPGIDIDSPVAPTRADLISTRMTSFSIVVRKSDRPSSDPADTERLQVTLAYIPKKEDGRAFFAALGGSVDFSAKVGRLWTYSLKARADAGISALIPISSRVSAASPDDPTFLVAGPGAGNFEFGASVTSRPNPSSGLSFAIPGPTGTRLEIGRLAFSIDADPSALEMTLRFTESALVIDSSDHDGLIRDLLGGAPLRLPFAATVGYSSARGLILEGSLAPVGSPASGQQNAPLAGGGNVGPPVIAATIPVGRTYGPVTIHEVALRLAVGPQGEPIRETNRVAVAADVSFSAQLGPLYLRLDQLGLSFLLDTSMPPAERNLRLVDAHLGVKPPLGIAISVDSDLITGGGTIFHDPAQGTYFGALVLTFENGLMLKAIGLISTRHPDGTEGSSIIILATLENLGWTIGSMNVDGLGVLLGINRTFDQTAVRAALPTGELRHVLFPPDPLHNMAEVLRGLTAFFPARRGSHMIGILAKLSFGRPPIVRLDLALIYAWGHSRRLIVLGRMSSNLPNDLGILRLNLDAVGVLDFSAGTVEVDAVLVDSKLCDRFVLTGAAALRGGSGTAGFALAVGGMHPSFPLPAGFPSLARITLAFTTGENPKLICQAYVAITSNTLQFGASAYLFAAAAGFSIEGSIGFDVLIQLLPFHYLAEFRASVQLKRGSRNLFKVSVKGALEGPLPLRVRGKATFEILWCDFSVSFDRTLVGGSTPSEVPAIDVLSEVLLAVGDVRNWRAQPPGASAQQVSVRSDNDPAVVLLHPMGALSVRQGIVPLNLSRDIDRVGVAAPSGARRFAITGVKLGPDEQAPSNIRDLFAPAQFFDLTDDEKLAAPSFEEMDAGITFGDDDYVLDMTTRAISTFDYTDISIGADGTPTVEPAPHHPDGARVLDMLLAGAASRSSLRRTLSARFHAEESEAAPRLSPTGWAVADVGTATAPTTPVTATWVEAQAQLHAMTDGGRRVVVSHTELAG